MRGNVQPGDVIIAIISRGTTTEAKSAEQVNALLAKLDKGASVAMRLRRGERSSSPPCASITANSIRRRPRSAGAQVTQHRIFTWLP